ncbi:MAG: lysophospholipid acyltransferase family protein [Acidobacteria bacterium]|nr:lysophospholipid acyltransferase family protein [Acidobacteriota bacterium]
MREWLEYVAAWTALKFLGLLPRPLARSAGAGVTAFAYWFRPPLRRAAAFNLQLAFPEWTPAQRHRTVRNLIRHIGWMAGEFSQFPRYNKKNIERIVVLDGFENYDAAHRKGKGVLFLTGHAGTWELAPFAQALFGYPLHFLVRPIDNNRVEALINKYRCLSGNKPIDKGQSARSILTVLKNGGTVGILIDQNTSIEEGVFVNFFGIPACTTSGLARIAMRTDAAVVPGFIHWDPSMRKYRLRFEPAVELARTGDESKDILENTSRFTLEVEKYARQYPDQWLWVHRRWKTRPPGEPSLYPF